MKESSEEKFTSGCVGFFAGDWSEIDSLLLRGDADLDKSTNSHENDTAYNGYDIILMAETVYAVSSLPNLYRLIKKVSIHNIHFADIFLFTWIFHVYYSLLTKNTLQCLRYPGGIVYMAGKKHYFGVGGGTRHFVRLVTEDGKFISSFLVIELFIHVPP